MIKYLLAFILSTILYSQEAKDVTLRVDYTKTIGLEDLPSITQNAFLIANQKASVYEIDFNNDPNFVDELDYGDGKDNETKILLRVRPDNNPAFFKKFEDKTIYYIQRVSDKPFLIKDSVNVFNWSIKDDYKTILGYNCQKATLDFRGRNYTAYFTFEIPFNTGPWKFSGLPGTILEIKEENDVFNIVANKVVISNQNTIIENPFEGKKTISWDEYIKKYKKKYDELMRYVGPDGTRITIPKKTIEVYIED